MISVQGPLVEVRAQSPWGAIVLNRDQKRNALSREMLRQISQALDDLHQEAKVRCIVLTGAGSCFCAGMDLQEMLDTSEQDDAWQMWHDDAVLYRDLVEKMLRFPKPIVAALNGPAMAGGMGLMLASDLVIAVPGAKMGLPEPRRGLVAGIVAPLLWFRAGGSHAARLLLSAAAVDAAEAYRIGLVHEVVEEDALWDRSVEICQEVARGAPSALQLTKRILNESIGEQLFTLLSTGAADSATARTTKAAVEGLTAFREKREPNWGD